MIDTDKYERMLTDDDGWMDLLVSNLLAEVKRLREEVKMLWQYVDAELMYNDGLLTVEGEMIE